MDKPYNAVLQVIAGVLFIALFAQLSLHLPSNAGGIPVTGQSLAVLLVGLLLRPPLGVAVAFAYVLLGVAGLPVFADGRSGPEVMAGGSGGFLVGFVAAAWLLGRMRAMGWRSSFGKCLFAMAAGTVTILAFGLGRLAMLYGAARALEYGFYPFWPGALAKAVVGAVLSAGYYKMIQAESRRF
ncbi:MAG: biotin transporter BioY [Phaeodactylibacter sp.]|nr:biotin transporter BioY [Phaeodactylibacter sp.]